MPSGDVPILRPPREARPALTTLIAAAPRDAALYRLRAQEAETALDFPAAEADWRAAAQHASDPYAAQLDLADFFHRRNHPRDELAALTAATSAKDDALQPAGHQRAWQAFERMASLAKNDALPAASTEPIYRAWLARYPKEPDAWRNLIGYLAANRQFAAAEAEISAYSDDLESVRLRAQVALLRGAPDAAIALYDAAFQPLWTEDMTGPYFKLLEEQGRLREFTAKAHAALAQNSTDLVAAARLFHYYRSQNNPAAARRVLLEFRIAKESASQPWTPNELSTLAQLFERLPDVNEAARLYYALYNVPPAGGPHTERALYALANLLLTAPDQPIQFGSGDLSFYQDIATLDSSPGFLNGILSLLLNFTGPHWEYQKQNQKSAAYFRREAGSRLVTLLAQRFPRSQYLAPLRASLVTAYAAYGDDATVIRAGRDYLAAFPNAASRVPVAMQVADALARANRTTEEFALYDQLLKELAAKASGVPIGANLTPASAETDPDSQPVPDLPFGRPRSAPQPTGARSEDYVQVLDKYLSRLAATGHTLDALRVYRTEIDRNPNDPGLYQRLAQFVEQNNLSREVEDVYTKAIAKFADRSWYHKLARWYLRKQQFSALEKISRDVIAIFSGADLEQYMSDISGVAHPNAALYLQLNRYAHERFPEDLVFVGNLVRAYGSRETPDAAAADRLLRQYWYYDAGLRTELFQRLSQQGRLSAELAAVRATVPTLAAGQFDQAVAANPAAVEFTVEAETWLSHFESAAPAARSLADAYPGRAELTGNASSLYRSIAAYYPADTDVAVTLAGDQQQADPRDAAILARMGDICADRELFTRARTYWERMPATQPGKPESYLDTATVYWDYYLFNDALRWLAAARTRFNDPALYAYEAGAIDEGKRDYAAAVREYMAGALAGQQDAHDRLIALLTRPTVRDFIDRGTAAAIAARPTPAAVSLRVAVLESLQRRKDLEALLQSRVEAEKSYTALADLEETARRLGFDAIEERAAERMAAVTNDPIDKMRLTLANARLRESKKDLGAATVAVDGLYRDHPLILGVIRAAVDFHVRNHQPAPAIDILLDASRHARADLAAQFTLEAARLATTSGQTDRARALLAQLLAKDPLRAEYLAAMADTYLQSKDDRGFRDYELAIIQQLKQSSLTPPERVARIASIRRGLIPVLDRMNDPAAAVDQYIEVVDSFPEDESLTREAAAYAIAHNQAARLLAFYRKTVTGAPLDYRWPIVLGRIETVTEEYAAAIADYERAVKDRPDRADVLQAKAHLEERLMRFDDAIKSYTRLYELTYRDPQHLIKVAELQARSGRNADAVSALKAAIYGSAGETAEADFSIARQLLDWRILPEAVSFADRGANLAGAGLFDPAASQVSHNAALWAEIMARARRMDAVLPHLASENPTAQQMVQVAGPVIAETYTPEEKLRLEQLLDARPSHAGALLELIQFAGLTAMEARWRSANMNNPGAANRNTRDPELDGRFAALQTQRGLYSELARRMEELAAANPGKPVEAPALVEAAQAYIADGDVPSQMRVLRKVLDRHALSGSLLDRYLKLLAARQPDALLALIAAAGSGDISNRAVQIAIANGRADLAYSAVRARGRTLPPVWTSAYTALTGEYFDDHSQPIDAAFRSALDTRTIGDRLKTPLKPDTVVVGDVWFYYGARYGDYLASGKNAAAEDWLPAPLEASPDDPGVYLALGDFYVERGQPAKAVVEFEKALQLDADRGDAHSRIACILWSQGRQPEAIARWKLALAAFVRVQSRGVAVPEPFWSRVARTFTDIGRLHAIGAMHDDMAHLLGDYYQRNDNYRLDELVQPAARASVESGQGFAWLVELAHTMDNPESILSTLMQTHGVTEPQRIVLQRDLVAFKAAQARAQFGDIRRNADFEVGQARVVLANMLLASGDVAGANAEWSQLPPDSAQVNCNLEIRLAVRGGRLDALLDRYRSTPADAMPPQELLSAAADLRRAGDESAARAVLEYFYDREIHAGHLIAANFLGLAEVKLQRGDAPAALALLNRMALVVDEGFDTLLPAARLLNQYGKTAEAADFLRRRVKAVPWDADARLQLGLFESVIADAQAPYHLRAEAARKSSAGVVPATELALLSTHSVSPEAASKPYQLEARIDAAQSTSVPEVKLRLWMEALAIRPENRQVRTGATFAALALHRDNLALALDQTGAQFQTGYYGGFIPYRPPVRSEATDAEKSSLAEALAAAAERIDDLSAAQNYLRTAISLRPADQQPPLQARLDAITAEQTRRAANLARQPAIRNAIEQTQIVQARIPGGPQ
jgi:Tfp pilus assembly protein PilF